MAEVKIHIVDSNLDDMGVKSDHQSTPFRFPDSTFQGYWPDPDDPVLNFYVGGNHFICRHCQKYIDLFEALIFLNSCKAIKKQE